VHGLLFHADEPLHVIGIGNRYGLPWPESGMESRHDSKTQPNPLDSNFT
jgi:hypothetical protein